jgi:2-phospho-L-lactate transferase/gluconeogenesis factor (CofD/UPF0052 family)
VRLIPEDQGGNSSESAAIKAFFNHRLSSDPVSARHEWLDIVEARSPLWNYIHSSKQELIRSFLNHLNLEIVKRARPSSVFNFQSASVGNLFLTGARLFSGSFESAIYLLGSITGVPSNVAVIPAINSNFSHHICAGLEDGTQIAGQNAISHPITPTAVPATTEESDAASPRTKHRRLSKELSDHDGIEDANLPGSLPTLRKPYIAFHKDVIEDLPSRIQRIWYINPYGQEIRPSPNPAALTALKESQAVIYSIGSLYTSIIPSLILKDIGQAIASPHIRHKILILNGSLDRETGPSTNPFSAEDFVSAIAHACAGRMVQRGEFARWVSHVVYMEGDGTPMVDKVALRAVGIECVRVYGRREGGAIYDGRALGQVLEAILERRYPRTDKGRRNTLEH